MMRDRGFTLVEISIVLVIISLLIVGVIKGTSLIENAKVSNAITLAQDLSVAVNTFKQQYHMLPGDMAIDKNAPEIPNVRPECLSDGSNKGNNDGLIDAAEPMCVPEVLFQAGLAKVDQDSGWAVFKSYYGPVKVIATSLSGVVINNGSNKFLASITHVVEFQNLPCAVVQAMDRKIDNDDLTTGKAIANFVADPNNSLTCAAGSIVLFYAVAL